MSNRMKALGIEHVVVLMLENRGFDHVMGWLYGPSDRPHFVKRDGDTRPFIGLSTVSDLERLANPSPIPTQKPIVPIRGARSPAIPEFNPGEHFTHIMAQMWGVPRSQIDWGDPLARNSAIYDLYKKYDDAPMNGYARDFAETIEHEASATPTADLVSQIMETYLPEQLPVLSGLARHYAVSDEWFCSVPSQTNTNRAFSTAGTSRGLVTNNYYDAAFQAGYERLRPGTVAAMKATGSTGSHADRLPMTTRSIFGLLSDFDVDWKLYWQAPWPPEGLLSGGKTVQYVRCMFPELDNAIYDDHFVRIDPMDQRNALFTAARSGKLPTVTWIEPKWGGGPVYRAGSAQGAVNISKQRAAAALRIVGTDMHPSCDTTVAEDFIHALYEALTESPVWEKTLFVLTFDENGGTYDHVPPPGSRPRNQPEVPPSTSYNPAPSGLDRTPPPGPYGRKSSMDPATRTEFGFMFDQLGIRVPTLLISPLIPQNTLFRSQTQIPFDHTSLIASILDWQGIRREDWSLGERTLRAPTFDTIFPDPVSVPTPRKDPDYSGGMVGARGRGNPVIAGSAYRLRYLGNPWSQPSNEPVYLGAPEWSYVSQGFFPTMTKTKEDAVGIAFEIGESDPQTTPIVNMSDVRVLTSKAGEVVSSGPVALKLNSLAVSDRQTYVFCAKERGAYHDLWQVRLMLSRSGRYLLEVGDVVALLSTAYMNLDSKRFDPLQRLVPHPDNSKYLTTRSGVWGAWQIEEFDS